MGDVPPPQTHRGTLSVPPPRAPIGSAVPPARAQSVVLSTPGAGGPPPPPPPSRSSATARIETMPEPPPAATPEAAEPEPLEPAGPDDFLYGRTLGEGAFARVVHVVLKAAPTVSYAVKILDKGFIQKERKGKYVLQERKLMTELEHPRLVQLFFSFQDANHLYMVMELAAGGELRAQIVRHCADNPIEDAACSAALSAFYCAETVLALEHCHRRGVVHRDLKPENILVASDGHTKLTDFGTALDTSVADAAERAGSFVGTAEYVSPEVLRNEAADRACDLWALGCILFQCLVGRPPFRAGSEYLTFQEIVKHCDGTQPLVHPSTVPEDAKDLVDALLRSAPDDRLGADLEEDGAALRAHPFFAAHVDWDTVETAPAPYAPVANACLDDTSGMREYGESEDWLDLDVDGDGCLPLAMEAMVERGSGSDDASCAAPAAATSRRASADEAHALGCSAAELARWKVFLLAGERFAKVGTVRKKVGLFSVKDRVLLLAEGAAEGPRLIYLDGAANKQKGSIPWTDAEPVAPEATGEGRFDVHTGPGNANRAYHLLTEDANGWIAAISESLARRRAEIARAL